MKKLMVCATLLALGLLACKNDVEKSATGVICEASMNTLMIVQADGDTLMFSTMDADRTQANGLLLGDTATVFYKGKAEGVITAAKVVVKPVCRPDTEILGSWVEPVEGMPGKVQGINIGEGGVASSVNMATLLYETWRVNGDSLFLTGKSLGNGQTIQFIDTLKINKITTDSLFLSAGEYNVSYSRVK